MLSRICSMGQLNLGVAGPRGLPTGDPATVELRYSFLGSPACSKTPLLSVPCKEALLVLLYLLTIQSQAPSMMEPSIPLPHVGGQKESKDQ